MLCVNCKREIPDNNEFCGFCGQQQIPQSQPVQAGGVDAAGPEQAPYAAQPSPGLTPPKARGRLAWKIFSLLVSIGLIIGGLSVFRGINSSELIVVFGFLWLAYDIFSIVTHFKKGGAAAANGAASAGAASLHISGSSTLPVAAAILMAANIIISLIPSIASGSLNFRFILNSLPAIVFIILALTLFKKNVKSLIVSIAFSIAINIASVVGFTPSWIFFIRLAADVILLLIIILTVSGKLASNRPFLSAAIGAFFIALITNVVIMMPLPNALGLLFFSVISILFHYGAYLAIALALKPADTDGAETISYPQ